MGKALYRKYRPTSFDQAVGQEHITKTLQQAIKSGRISHAYLFTGPRGIGKTSVARILAHEVNGLPYTDESIHLDIIEIDAASNRRIDEIRDLRDKVHISPTSAKYKVYIIDEVHMLTREAFNALLKTLEEPPAHCIFILATTEVHKLPETIISRTQRFSFIPVSSETAAKHLGSIAKKEKISITNEALLLLAQHGQGSFRDSISLLDQLSNTGNDITEETVRDLLGLPASSTIGEIIILIQKGDSNGILNKLDELSTQGSNPQSIAKELSTQLRKLLIDGNYTPWIPKLLRELLDVSSSAHPQESLEIALLEAAAGNIGSSTTPKPPTAISTTPKSSQNSKPKTTKEKQESNSAELTAVEIKTEPEKNKVINFTDFDITYWPQVVEYAKKHAASLYTALKLAKPKLDGNILTLYFEFPLHQKKINQSHQKEIIGQMIEDIAKAKVKVECEVNKEIFKSMKLEKLNIPKIEINEIQKESDTPLKSISNIFGKAEVLESS